MTEAAPEISTLSALFDRDPLSLSQQEIGMIVASLREARNQWALDEAKAQAEGKKPRGKAKAPLVEINLEDLGL